MLRYLKKIFGKDKNTEEKPLWTDLEEVEVEEEITTYTYEIEWRGDRDPSIIEAEGFLINSDRSLVQFSYLEDAWVYPDKNIATSINAKRWINSDEYRMISIIDETTKTVTARAKIGMMDCGRTGRRKRVKEQLGFEISNE